MLLALHCCLTVHGIKIAAYNVRVFGQSKLGNNVAMNMITQVRLYRSLISVFLFKFCTLLNNFMTTYCLNLCNPHIIIAICTKFNCMHIRGMAISMTLCMHVRGAEIERATIGGPELSERVSVHIIIIIPVCTAIQVINIQFDH